MEVLQMFDLLDQEIDSWFTNHKPLFPTLPYTILSLLFMLPLDQLLEALLRGQPHPLLLINFFYLFWPRGCRRPWWGWVPKLGRAPSQLNREPSDIGCNTLSHYATCSKNVSSQLKKTETITYRPTSWTQHKNLQVESSLVLTFSSPKNNP